MGAMGRARELGVDVPGDLSVVGFDDHDLAEPFGLTTIRQPVQQLGERIAEWILEIVNAEEPGRPEPDHVNIPVELIERSSCARPATESL